MAQNTYKTPPKAPVVKKKRENRLLNYLNQTIGFDRLFGEDNPWPIKHFDRIMWISFLLILYIGFNHNAERLIRNIQRVKAVVDEKRAEYTTLQADFKKSGKQSEISKHVIATGLEEPVTPPLKIVVKSEEDTQP
ncbi:FtsL-like putative cell division protein [Larkinella insperata]|uniref:FtsL-like putative cell division protein n=1 Tax=Larkinella insperata TaxID=332158 RepID=A0ABW3Q9D2_9BACT|nr:FtsL-like putative cell division protein [Larkinella insperata]